MKTTLNQIREKSPCPSGWKRLLASLQKTSSDDESLSIVTILNSNGVVDAIWCLQAVEGRTKEISLFGVWCARQVQHLMTDQRSIDAVDVAERFANGEASHEEIAAARDAAWAARAEACADTSAAAWAAHDAAEAAAWAGAGAAAARFAGEAAAGTFAGAAAARSAGAASQEQRLRELCAECDAESKDAA